MALVGAYSNPRVEAEKLEALLRKLPSLSDLVPEGRPRNTTKSIRKMRNKEAEEMVTAYEAGVTVYQLARQYKIARQTVSKILKSRGVTMRMGGMSEEQIVEAVRLYQDEGWSLARIGERLGFHGMTVRSRLAERGVEIRRSREH